LQFGGGRWDSGNLSFDDGRWKGGGWDVLSGNVALRISSKDLFNKGVLGGGRKEVLLLVFMVLGLMGGNVSEDVKTENWGGGDGSTSNNVHGTVGDVAEGVVFRVVKDRPSELGGWGTGDERSGCWGSVSIKIRTWEVPSVVVRLEDFEDSGGGVGDVLLIYVIEGRPGSNRDVGEGRGGDNGGLGVSEGHFTYTISSTLETVLMSRPTTGYGKQWATT